MIMSVLEHAWIIFAFQLKLCYNISIERKDKEEIMHKVVYIKTTWGHKTDCPLCDNCNEFEVYGTVGDITIVHCTNCGYEMRFNENFWASPLEEIGE